MTFQQWLETQTDFEESIFYDANGEERTCWVGDNDPKYESKVIKVVANGCLAHVYTDWRN